jgi:hypothetical protein
VRKLAVLLVAAFLSAATVSAMAAILVVGLRLADGNAPLTAAPPSAAVAAAAQVIAAVAMLSVAMLTLWYARATQQMAWSMDASRLAASVVAFADAHGPYVGFRIENFGAGPAENVLVTFLEPLTIAGGGRRLAEYKQGDTVKLALLAPGQIVWRPVTTVGVRSGNFSPAKVTCEWQDGTGSGSVDYVIDIGPLVSDLHDASLADVVKAIKDIKP